MMRLTAAVIVTYNDKVNLSTVQPGRNMKNEMVANASFTHRTENNK